MPWASIHPSVHSPPALASSDHADGCASSEAARSHSARSRSPRLDHPLFSRAAATSQASQPLAYDNSNSNMTSNKSNVWDAVDEPAAKVSSSSSDDRQASASPAAADSPLRIDFNSPTCVHASHLFPLWMIHILLLPLLLRAQVPTPAATSIVPPFQLDESMYLAPVPEESGFLSKLWGKCKREPFVPIGQSKGGGEAEGRRGGGGEQGDGRSGSGGRRRSWPAGTRARAEPLHHGSRHATLCWAMEMLST